MILVDATDLRAERPDRLLFDDVSLTISSGDRLAIVGVNGTGKSTLLGAIAGSRPVDGGTVRRGRSARISHLDQDAPLPSGTVGSVTGDRWEAAAVRDRLGLGGLDDRPTDQLSGGQIKRVALARAMLAAGPPGGGPPDADDLLILDEPTNHLDVTAIAWLEDWLSRFTGGLVLVSHDRHVLDRVCNRMVELDRGQAHVHEGGYASYLDARAERAVRAEDAETKRRNLARAELAWLRRGAPARTSKPKARIEEATRLVEGGPAGAELRDAGLDLHLGTPRLGDKVIECRGVGATVGGRRLFDGVDLLLDRRERLGIVGPNGAGKSTLLRILAGEREPDGGAVDTGPTVRLAMFSQDAAELDPDARVRELVSGGRREVTIADKVLMERFWFDGDAQFARVGTLSGGERRRLQLLLTLQAQPNVLLLDEPTNDLDLDTLRVLEDFLDEWPGALVVVSHDRALLERTVVDVLEIDGDGAARRIAGGVAAHLAAVAGQRARGKATTVSSTSAGGRSDGGGGRSGGGRGAVTSPSAGRNEGGGGSGSSVGADTVSGSRTDAGGSGTAVGSGPASGSRTAAGSGTAAGPSPSPSPSTVRRELNRTERELTKATERRDRIAAELEAAIGDHEALARLGRDLDDATAATDAAEEAWLEWAERAESVNPGLLR